MLADKIRTTLPSTYEAEAIIIVATIRFEDVDQNVNYMHNYINIWPRVHIR